MSIDKTKEKDSDKDLEDISLKEGGDSQKAKESDKEKTVKKEEVPEKKAKKITLTEFQILYNKYLYCFGVNFLTAPSDFNNSIKKSRAFEKCIKNKLLLQQKEYYARCQEVSSNYITTIDSEQRFNLSAFLNAKGYTSDLSGLNLSSFDFAGVSFAGINLARTKMCNSNFLIESSSSYDCHLKASFKDAILNNTNLKGAKVKFTYGNAGKGFATHGQIGIKEAALQAGQVIIGDSQVTAALAKKYNFKTSEGDITAFLSPGGPK